MPQAADGAPDPDALTQRLLSAVGDVVITGHDCGTARGVAMLPHDPPTGRPVYAVIPGRVACHPIEHGWTRETIVVAGGLITRAQATRVNETVVVRSPMTCDADPGVCRLCYGLDHACDELVTEGTAVGVLAAHALGDLARKLDGARVVCFSAIRPESHRMHVNLLGNTRRLTDFLEARRPPAPAILAAVGGRVVRVTDGPRPLAHVVHLQETDDDGAPVGDAREHPIPAGCHLRVGDDDWVMKGDPLTDGRIDPNELHRILGRDAALIHLLRGFQDCYVAWTELEVDDRHAELVLGRLFRDRPNPAPQQTAGA